MDFHNQIMNIPAKLPATFNHGETAAMSYKLGHRDARHSAAEIANVADTIIADLKSTLASAFREIEKLNNEAVILSRIESFIADGFRDEEQNEQPSQWSAGWYDYGKAIARQIQIMRGQATSDNAPGRD